MASGLLIWMNYLILSYLILSYFVVSYRPYTYAYYRLIFFWSNQYDQQKFGGYFLYIRKDNVYLDILNQRRELWVWRNLSITHYKYIYAKSLAAGLLWRYRKSHFTSLWRKESESKSTKNHQKHQWSFHVYLINYLENYNIRYSYNQIEESKLP